MKTKTGVALLIVLLSVMIMSLFISQLQYTRAIDLKISRSSKAKLQAYYLAQSAARMGILRLHVYKELQNLLAGSNSSALASMIPKQIQSQVWSFPLPAFPIEGSKGPDTKKSLAPGIFMSVIKGEGSKIPINLLDGNIHRMTNDIANDGALAVQKQVNDQLVNLIQLKFDNDPDFKKLYDTTQPQDFVTAIQDWVTSNGTATGGSQKDDVYLSRKPPYKARGDRFGALSEINMINYWDDTMLAFLRDDISLFNLRPKINCNTLSLERFRAYSNNLFTDDELAIIQKRRTEEPFATLKECTTFIQTNSDMPNGASFVLPKAITDAGEYDRETVFYIEGTGIVGDAKARVHLYVRLEESLPLALTQTQTAQQQQQTTTSTTTTQSQSSSSAPAQINDLHVLRYEEGGAG